MALELKSYDLKIKPLRWSLVIASILIAMFAPGDMAIIPDSVQSAYLVSRFGIQIPVILLYLAFSYTQIFKKYAQLGLLMAITIISFANFWLIKQCWLIAGFSFPYEGTILYAFFGLLVLRLHMRFAVVFILLNTAGFAVLVYSFPLYGVYTSNYLGFVIASQFISFYASYHLWLSMRQSDNLNEELTELSRRDQLTGLLNRRAYEEQVSSLLDMAVRADIPLSTFILDIDHFKKYNDHYGHIAGDEVIKKQAEILNQVFQRQSDVAGRYGGEEFIVFAINLTTEQCIQKARQILDLWKELNIQHEFSETAEHITCSIGIHCRVPMRKEHLNKEIIWCADQALLRAKKSGRNCISVYNPDTD